MEESQSGVHLDIKPCSKCGKEAWRTAHGTAARDEDGEVRTRVWYECRDRSCHHVWSEFRPHPDQY